MRICKCWKKYLERQLKKVVRNENLQRKKDGQILICSCKPVSASSGRDGIVRLEGRPTAQGRRELQRRWVLLLKGTFLPLCRGRRRWRLCGEGLLQLPRVCCSPRTSSRRQGQLSWRQCGGERRTRQPWSIDLMEERVLELDLESSTRWRTSSWLTRCSARSRCIPMLRCDQLFVVVRLSYWGIPLLRCYLLFVVVRWILWRSLNKYLEQHLLAPQVL